MKKIMMSMLVLFGFTAALIATASNTKAEPVLPEGGSCVETGDCGTTAGGVKLKGFWRESAE